MKTSTANGESAAESAAIPTLADVSPEFAELVAKRDALQARHAELDAEVQELIVYLSNSEGMTGAEIPSRVDELLGGVAAARPGIALTEKRARLAAARADRNDHAAALTALKRLVADARSKASIKVCDIVQPRYAAIIAKKCQLLLAMREVQIEYHQFVDELEAGDVAWVHLFPMPLRFLGAPNDNEGRPAKYLKEAAEHGFIPPELIPEDLRWDRPSKAGW